MQLYNSKQAGTLIRGAQFGQGAIFRAPGAAVLTREMRRGGDAGRMAALAEHASTVSRVNMELNRALCESGALTHALQAQLEEARGEAAALRAQLGEALDAAAALQAQLAPLQAVWCIQVTTLAPYHTHMTPEPG